jgi:hypothetical protein
VSGDVTSPIELDPEDDPAVAVEIDRLMVTGTEMLAATGEIDRTSIDWCEQQSVDAIDSMLRRIARRRARIAEANAVYTARVERLDAWLDETTRRDKREIAWLDSLVQAWGRARRRATGHPTMSLPSGVISTRHYQARPRIVDQDALVAWCRDNGRYEWIKSTTTYSVPAVYLPKILSENPTVPGVEMTPERTDADVSLTTEMEQR